MTTQLRLLALAFFSAALLRAADVVPVFNATLTVGKEHRFVLIDAEGKASSFLKLGESFAGYKLKAYDAKESALELERDGKTVRVMLVADAAIQNAPALATPATLADATAVLNAMNFEQMMEKTMGAARKQQRAMVEKMMGQMMPAGADRDAMLEFQKKMMDEIMSAMNFGAIKGEVAKIYSEVFTKEQLQGLGAFFNSSSGQAYTDKQPEIMAKMNEIMMQRMMPVMPKIQQMAQEFAMEQKAKRAGGSAPAPAAPTPAAPAPKQ